MENLFLTDLLIQLPVKQVPSFRRKKLRGKQLARGTLNSNGKNSREERAQIQRVNEVDSVIVESKVSRRLALERPNQKTETQTVDSKV